MNRAAHLVALSFVVMLLLAGGMHIAFSQTGSASPSNDHLPAALRAEVEQLKNEYRQHPTNADNIARRARIVADWVDGRALAGLETPQHGPGIASYAAEAPKGEAAEAAGRRVDATINEMAFRDDQPDGLGMLVAEDLGPFRVRTHQTLRQHWTVGSEPVEPGGGFWVARHFSVNSGPFQTQAPGADGYMTITSSNPAVRFETDQIMASGHHGGFRNPEPAMVFRLAEGRLREGDTVTITYGDTSGGGPGLLMPSMSGASIPFPLYVTFDASDDWLMLPILPFVTEGNDATGVHGFAPSIVAVGEPFELSVRAEDRWRNRATGTIPAFEVLLNGTKVAMTEAGGSAIQLVELQVDEAGPHWITLRSPDGEITGEANPVLALASLDYGIYWGDTHGHSGYAEGIGTVDYFMQFARDDARLDFVTHTEHDTSLDKSEWELMRRTTQAYDAPGEFIPYLGYEWTSFAMRGGHHNVLFRHIQGPEPISALEYRTLSKFYQGLRENYPSKDVVVIPHAHNPGDYRDSDPELEPLIEIMSMHGTFEWFLKEYLSHGHQVGFVAASDDHLSHPGYTSPNRDSLAQRGGLGAVIAPKRDRDLIFDAMKQSRTYATTGDRMILDFTVNGETMGQRTAYDETRRIAGRVIGTAPIEAVDVFKNNEIIWSRNYVTDAGAARGEVELRLYFHSDETPYHRGDAPRGWRHWRGNLRVEGAQLEDAELVDFYNEWTQHLDRDGNQVKFATHTRGDTSSIRLRLSNTRRNATLVLDLEDAMETGSAPPFYRRHQLLSGGEVRLPLSQMINGQLKQSVPVVGYQDGITLRHVITGGERDINFELTDVEDPRQGDYYYVRVRQVNDATAWSSPVWVGGYPHL